MHDARSSFMFMPSIDLFTRSKEKEENHYGQVDLLCIKDGQFIIGEIKQSVGLFDANDFEKMSSLAKLIKPDLILFSSMDEKPNKMVEENIAKLKSELVPLEVDVQWFPINYWVFYDFPLDKNFERPSRRSANLPKQAKIPPHL